MNAPPLHIESFPIRNSAAVVESRDRCILELLDRPRTIVELIEASPIYGGRAYAPGVLDYWEGQMISKHLERLERQGRIRRIEREEVDLCGPGVNGGHTVRPQGAAGISDRIHDCTRWTRR
jgi:hypothetical protein